MKKISSGGARTALVSVEFDSAEADALTRTHTAFENFEALLAAPGYRPSINVLANSARRLADLYDAAQALRGDRRRAHRYKIATMRSATGRLRPELANGVRAGLANGLEVRS